MTTKTRPSGTQAKERRAKHAQAQASYMERKRAEGKEWLATWVPGEARDTFKELAKRVNDNGAKPDKDVLKEAKALAKTNGTKLPDWAKDHSVLLGIWVLANKEAATPRKKKKSD